MNNLDAREAATRYLSNKYEGMDFYNGNKDPYLEFGEKNKNAFANEIRNGRQFSFKVKNTTGNAILLCLNPANLDVLGVVSTAVGTAATVHYHNNASLNDYGFHADVIDDGIIKTGLLVTSYDAKIRHLLNYVRNNPTRVVSIIVQANDVSFYEGTIFFVKINPFDDTKKITIPMTDSFSPQQNQDKKIIIDTSEFDAQFDDQTLAFINIPATANGVNDVEAVITLKIGAVENSALALKRKADAASII